MKTITTEKKKKVKKVSPTQRSLKLLRDAGWVCAITEHWNPFAFIRQDLFGFVDILAIKHKAMLAVQTTSDDGSHMSSRVRKITDNPNYELLKSTRCKIMVQGWKKVKNKWKVRIINL